MFGISVKFSADRDDLAERFFDKKDLTEMLSCDVLTGWRKIGGFLRDFGSEWVFFGDGVKFWAQNQ